MKDKDLFKWIEDDGEWCDCVHCSGQPELTNFFEICEEVENIDDPLCELFTRITRITQTSTGVQQGNISTYIYDNEEIAYAYFKDYLSEEEWKTQLMFGEGFYKVEANGYTNTIFLETRKVQNNPKF